MRLSSTITRHGLRYVSNIVFLNLLIMAWLGTTHVQAANPSSKDSFTPLNRFGRMVHEYFVEHVRAVERQANKHRAALRTRADAETYVRDVRRKIQRSFGP